MNDSSQSFRFWSLDIVRGLSVLAVIGFHALPLPNTEYALSDTSMVWLNWLKYGGALGVSVFFVVSGFSIHLSLARKLTVKPDLQPEWSTFFRRRLRRLYPAYLSAIALSLALNFSWALIRRRDIFAHLPRIWDLLSHLMLLHTLSAETFFGVIPALWFIGVLAHLYLLYPVFFGLAQRWGMNRALLIVLLCTLACRLVSQSLALTPVDSTLESILWNNAPQRWFEWCIGAWIAQQVAQRTQLRLKYTWLFFLLIFLWLPIGSGIKLLYEPLMGCWIAFMLWSVVTYESGATCHFLYLPILYLGRVSYPAYLLHQIFIPYVRSALSHVPLNVTNRFILLLGLVLATTLPISVLFHQLLELPLPKSNTYTQP